jgi:hypothetical protein
MRRMSQSLVLRLLLIVALLLTQLGGMTHGIAHVMADQAQDQSQPHDKQCDLCAAYAQVGSALPGSPAHLFATEQGLSFLALATSSFHSFVFSAFSVRAPPYSA